MVNTINTNPPIYGFSIDGYGTSTPSTSNDATVSYEDAFRTIYIRTDTSNYGQLSPINTAGHGYVHSALYSDTQKAHMIDASGDLYRVQNTMQAVMTMTFQKPDGTIVTLSNVTTQAITLMPVDANGVAVVGAVAQVMYFPLASYATNTAFVNYTLIKVNTTSVGQYSNNTTISAMSTTQIKLLPQTCFVRDTLILTKNGQIPIQKIQLGDLIWTLDNGFQYVKWIGSRKTSGIRKNAPIHIKQNIFGNILPITLSPNHKIHFQGEIANRLFRVPEILIAAKNLIFQQGVSIKPVETIEYFHILFDNHEIIRSNFILVESLFLSNLSISSLHNFYQDEFCLQLDMADAMHASCRSCLSNQEARVYLQHCA